MDQSNLTNATEAVLKAASEAAANVTQSAMNRTQKILDLALNATSSESGFLNITNSSFIEPQKYENANIGLRITNLPSQYQPFELTSFEGCFIQFQYMCMVMFGYNGQNPLTDISTTNTIEITAYVPKGNPELLEGCKCDTLMEFVQKRFNIMQSNYDDFFFLNDNQTTIGKKYPAWQIEFLHNGYHQGLKHEHRNVAVFTKMNDIFYEIEYGESHQEYARILTQFKQIIESIEFIPIQELSILKQEEKTPSFMTKN